MFKVNEVYHGFKLKEETRIPEIDSVARVFEHVKSGARLLHLENKDDNKTFFISFRTTPGDDTGVPHILEHVVLCGSRKFKSKDVFMSMAKSSLNTFINAMTFPDKTMYPISSRNQKDFFNLMDVYLDSVLYPDLYDNYQHLRQEGWRYELDGESGSLAYKGIVYSEMQGALSAPEDILACNLNKALFPNTTYAFNSGGDPRFIPDLTQEKFEKFHSKFYHPSNSYIYLYGDQDLDQCLRFINDEYLSNFDRIEVPSHIDDAKSFSKMVEKIDEYPIGEDEDENNASFIALGFAGEEAKNPDFYLPMQLLNDMLVKSSAAPIKKALLEAGIGGSVLSNEEIGIDFVKKTLFAVAINNTNEDKKEEFKKVIFDTLNSLVKNGIDRKLIEASINSMEFKLREADPWEIGNKGLTYGLTVMDSWLYDGDPLAHLRYEDKLNELKKEMYNNYFENFIQKYLLDNKNSALVILKPKKGLAERRSKELKAKLQKYKETLTEDQLKDLKKKNKELKEAQMREDTPEEIKTIPKLSLNDISKKAEIIPQTITEKNGVKLLFQNMNTNKIAYINLLFDASIVEEKYIPYLGLLRDILGKIDTKDKSYLELSTEILIKTGGIKFSSEVYEETKNIDKYHPKFIVNAKVLPQNIPALFELINEIITLTKFEDSKRIKEVVQEIRTKLKRYVTGAGDELSINRAASYFSEANKYIDMLSGVSYYEFICDIEKNFEAKYHEIQKALMNVYETIFNKNNLIISYTGEEEYLSAINSNMNIILNNLSNEKMHSADISFRPSKDVEGIITPSNVQFVAKVFDFNKLGYKYSGKMKVLQNIINSEYLYTRVRLQGGAYGCYMNVERDRIAITSYRDPNLAETIKTYDKAAEFLKNAEYTVEDMQNFIIGTIGKIDRPLTPDNKGERAAKNYICGISNEDIQKERDEILSTSIMDVKDFADVLKKGMDEKYCCVVGNEAKINENKSIFDKIKVLL